jgi:hypothetical protein
LTYPAGKLRDHPPLRTQDEVIRGFVSSGKWTRHQAIAFLVDVGESYARAVERVNAMGSTP